MFSLIQNIQGLFKDRKMFQKILLSFLICGFITGTAGALRTEDFSDRTSAITGSGMEPVVQNNQLPVAMIRVDSESGPAPLTVTFDGSRSYDPDGVISSFRWEFPDGTIGSGSSVSHTFLSPGTQSVQLVVTDGRGSSSGPAYTNIHVESGPGIVQGSSGETGLVVIKPINRGGITGRDIAVRTDQTLVSVIEHNRQGSATTDGTPCDDGNACTINDVISSGTCTGGIATNCDDDDPDTTDTCDSSSGCVHSLPGGKVVVIQGGRTEENYEGRSPGVRILSQEREGDIQPPDNNSGITVKSLGKTDPGSDPIGGVVSFVFGIFSLGSAQPASQHSTGKEIGTGNLENARPWITCPAGSLCLEESVAKAQFLSYTQVSDEICRQGDNVIGAGGPVQSASLRCYVPECECMSEQLAKVKWGSNYEKCDNEKCGDCLDYTDGNCDYPYWKYNFRRVIANSSSITRIEPGVKSNNDWDRDGITNDVDNCPFTANPDQADTGEYSFIDYGKETGLKSSAAPDTIGNACDNCPDKPNKDQWDSDKDTVGDACDNCPKIPNKDQLDTDGDGIGNDCDPCKNASALRDKDGDCWEDSFDNCEKMENDDQKDRDNDKIGDVCDPCPDTNPNDADSDWADDCMDNCLGKRNTNQADSDGDGIGDACDENPLSIKFKESIYLNKTEDMSWDADNDTLKDDLENQIASRFKPWLRFDHDENSKRPVEPVTVFQVRPVNCTGLGCPSPHHLKLVFSLYFLNDGGYGPGGSGGGVKWCVGEDRHLGDSFNIEYYLESKDKGKTWDVTRYIGGRWDKGCGYPIPSGASATASATIEWHTVQRCGHNDEKESQVIKGKPNYNCYNFYTYDPIANETCSPSREMELHDFSGAVNTSGTHPALYISASKHHTYIDNHYDEDTCGCDSFYSSWDCEDDLDGQKYQGFPNLKSEISRPNAYNNVGEPETDAHPSPPFVNCMRNLPAKVTVEMCNQVDCWRSLHLPMMGYPGDANYQGLVKNGFFMANADPECDGGAYYSAWGNTRVYGKDGDPGGKFWERKPFTKIDGVL